MFIRIRTHRPTESDDDMCLASHADYECTLPQHVGPHVAHVDSYHFAAVWDDDRSTDPTP